MPLHVEHRITRLGVLVESFREEDDRAEVHRPSPELAELLALDTNVLDVLRVLGRIDRRNDSIESQGYRLVRRGVDAQSSRRAVEIARGAFPLLAFAVVHGKLQHAAVGPVKRFVNVHQGLDDVFPRREPRRAVRRDTRSRSRRGSRLRRPRARSRRLRRSAASRVTYRFEIAARPLPPSRASPEGARRAARSEARRHSGRRSGGRPPRRSTRERERESDSNESSRRDYSNLRPLASRT